HAQGRPAQPKRGVVAQGLRCASISATRGFDPMPATRAFLTWTAALAATSWAGISLAELGRFSGWVSLGVGLIAAALIAHGLSGPSAWRPAKSRIAPAAAIAATITLIPTIDTTLLSQDASVHLAAGHWLARTGSFAIPDPLLDGLPEKTRLELFEIA